MTTKPLCMDATEFQSWNEVAQHSGLKRVTPCSDCLHAFALEMRAEGRCDGIPRGYQDEDCDDGADLRERGLVGVARSAEMRMERKRARAREAIAMADRGMTRPQIGAALNVKVWTVGLYLRMERELRRGAA